jgi:hypothetical protein
MKQPVVIDRATFRALYRKSSLTLEQRKEIEDALSNPFIAVSERLPEERATVTVLLADGSIIFGCSYWDGVRFHGSSILCIADPIAWRATEVV